MNKQFFRHIALAALLSLPVIGGCKPAETPPASPPGTNPIPVTPPVTNATGAGAESADAPARAHPDESVQPEVPFAVERPMPAHLNATYALSEVVKLAQAGVDEEVLLSFVNGSTTSFLLGADEIIYLTDIGVPATVINSMLERDRTLKTTVAAVAPVPTATATATQAVAVAPSYEVPPEATAAQPTEAAVTETDFVDALSPYGTWIDVEGYGRCWQPTVVVVNRNWRPYCDGGRWIYTDSGWYWYSDYSWGWAPFHYGRWFSHPRWGWCWYPGYTWGPAWVTWSYTDSYCGWAPLPPAAVYGGGGFTYYGSAVSVSFGFGLGYSCYSYVPWRYFCDYRPWRYCAPRPHCKEIYSRATCHNDYAWDRNHRAVNRGLPPERVASYTRTEIRRVNVREVTDNRIGPGRREEIAQDGRSLEIRRPAPTSARGHPAGRSSLATEARNAPIPVASPATDVSTSRGVQRARPVRGTVADRSPEATGQPVVNSSQVTAGAGRTAVDHSGRAAAGRPLVVVGNGDGRQPTPSTWNPYQTERSHPVREEVASVTPAEVESAPAVAPPVSSWTPPGRPNGGASQPSQLIRVGRGIEDRSGGPTYRVYSSPQSPPASAPSYGPPPTSSAAAPARPSAAQPSASDDGNVSRPNYQPSAPPNYSAPRQADRPAQYNSPPPRPAPAETRTAPRVEPRPAPESRSAPSRSESSRPDSRPAQSDSNRGSRPR